jgi:hypothetical protein
VNDHAAPYLGGRFPIDQAMTARAGDEVQVRHANTPTRPPCPADTRPAPASWRISAPAILGRHPVNRLGRMVAEQARRIAGVPICQRRRRAAVESFDGSPSMSAGGGAHRSHSCGVGLRRSARAPPALRCTPDPSAASPPAPPHRSTHRARTALVSQELRRRLLGRADPRLGHKYASPVRDSRSSSAGTRQPAPAKVRRSSSSGVPRRGRPTVGQMKKATSRSSSTEASAAARPTSVSEEAPARPRGRRSGRAGRRPRGRQAGGRTSPPARSGARAPASAGHRRRPRDRSASPRRYPT